ncbi:MAG: hypothetical protein OFPI_02520 [Osedax symbiont Rs2]|nr:MAG: hypothetical protein OFPI_02520 [Osedax symbiont Rs2]
MKQGLLVLGLILLTGCAMAPKQELTDYKAHSNALTGVAMCADAGHVTTAQSEELMQIMYGRLAQDYSYDPEKRASQYSARLDELKVQLDQADATGLEFFEQVCKQIPSMLAYNRTAKDNIKVPQFD